MFDLPIEKFAYTGKDKFKIDKAPTKVDPFYIDRNDYQTKLREIQAQMIERHKMLYAHDKYSLLLIFQAMDAAGKDGAIQHVMSGLNPQGCQVYSFKAPSQEELDHDFLWRCHKALPERGRIGVFNRSYYEDVLIVKVRPELLQSKKLPEEYAPKKKSEEEFWQNRYQDIANMEAYLTRQGTHIVKFFLHVSKKEQKKRLLDRLNEPAKNWKLALADVQERQRWDVYMDAYETCINQTATKNCPWYAIPADDKQNARLLIANIVLEELKSMCLEYPPLSDKQKLELESIRQLLENE